MTKKLTKIVATLGPASDSEEMIQKLLESGVNVFRFNTKHGTPQWHEERIKRVQAVADKMKISIGILLDLQGPEIRVETKQGGEIVIEEGQKIGMSYKFFDDSISLVVSEKNIIDHLDVGDQFFIDDGRLTLRVVSKSKDRIEITSDKQAIVKPRKGVNMPDKVLDLPSLVDADLKQLDMAALNKVDFVALSFVRNVKDVEYLRNELKKRKVHAKIVLKIENRSALQNIDSLIEAGDAVMVARGDMGIEVSIEEIAYWQKLIIEKCRAAYKPVITATEMLDSMTRQPRPTRAEATDVSNAVFDGTDAVMLSGETAQGEYPQEAVETMARIVTFTESKLAIDFEETSAEDLTQLICIAAMKMVANDGMPVDKIVVFSHTGYTAQVISSFRPNVPIYAITDSQKTVESLSLSYGVEGVKFELDPKEAITPLHIVNELVKLGYLEKEESVLVIHGARWQAPGLTNSITLVTA